MDYHYNSDMEKIPLRTSIAVLLATLSATVVANDNWPRFRGVNGEGVSEIRIPAAWTGDEDLARVL